MIAFLDKIKIILKYVRNMDSKNLKILFNVILDIFFTLFILIPVVSVINAIYSDKKLFAPLHNISLLLFILVTILIIIELIYIIYLKHNISEIFGDFPKNEFIILKRIKAVSCVIRLIGMVSIFSRLYNLCVNIWRKCTTSSKIEKKLCQNQQDKLVVFILFSLLFIWILFSDWKSINIISTIICWFIVWRLLEILAYQSSIVFQERIASMSRSIVLFVINLSEAIVIYAILYLKYAAIGYCKFKAIQKPFEALYFSLVSISTTGFGDIMPINRCGKILAFSEIAIGVLLLVVFFSILIKHKDDRFLCLDCKHIDDKKLTCKAFPNGIPRHIFLNKIKHDHIIKGQIETYLYELKELK